MPLSLEVTDSETAGNIAELIFERRVREAKPEWIAELFERLVWLLDDNGEQICATMRQWVEDGDLERARVALAFRENQIYRTRPEMMKAFESLSLRFPELRGRCGEILAEWDSGGGRDGRDGWGA